MTSANAASPSPGEIGRQIIAELRGQAFLDERMKKQNTFNSVLQDYADEGPDRDPLPVGAAHVAGLVLLRHAGLESLRR